jgi:hypothetical protein
MRAFVLSLLLPSLALGATLEGSTDSLEVVTTGATVSLDYHCAWSNVTATALTTPGSSTNNIAAATTTAIIAAPSASNWRYIRQCSFDNVNTIAVGVTIQIDRSAANRVLWSGSLAAGEHLAMDADGDFHVYVSSGAEKTDQGTAAYSGRVYEFSKSCTAYDTIGYHINCSNGTGFPGAFTIGAPGVNGAARVCDTAAGALITGSHVVADPASGGLYLTRFGTNASVVGTYGLVDILWQGTGYTLPAGAQAITTPAWPARDVNGSTNGEGVRIAILVLGTLGNAAAIATSTITYVNSNGDPGRTGILTGAVGFQLPATALISTWVPFTLQAGDTGVRSISSFTTGTTYTSGTFALVAFRTLAYDGVTVANFPSGSLNNRTGLAPGVRIWNDTCFNIVGMGAIAVTAPLMTSGIIELMER